jgi:(2Fe-2S) ferredoxin
MTRPTDTADCLIVCIGKDCRKSKGFDALLELAAATTGPMQVTCQSICDGPVVGVCATGSIAWYSHVRGSKLRAAVVEAASRGRVRTRLRSREERKKRDQLRHPRQLRPMRLRSGRVTSTSPRPTSPTSTI